MASLSMCVRNEAAPAQLLLSTLLDKPILCRVREDNEACITAAKKGYSPALRHRPRHQRCALGVVHETFFEDAGATAEEKQARRERIELFGEFQLEHFEMSKHKGDYFTKELPRQAVENAYALMQFKPRSRGV